MDVMRALAGVHHFQVDQAAGDAELVGERHVGQGPREYRADRPFKRPVGVLRAQAYWPHFEPADWRLGKAWLVACGGVNRALLQFIRTPSTFVTRRWWAGGWIPTVTTSASAPFDLPTKMKLIPSLFLLLQLLAPLAFAAAPDAEAPAPRFVINTGGDVSADDQAKVLAALEGSYGRISAELKTTPEQPFNVYLYSSRLGYAWATGNWGASGSAAGPGKIHLMVTQPDGEKAEVVAVHEFAHSVTIKLLMDHAPQPLDVADFDRKFEKFPVWLWEAIAVYEANQLHHPKRLKFISTTTYPSLAELDNRSQGGKIYKAGYTVIEYILASHGQDGLIKLILAYGDTKVLGKTSEEFAKSWHEFVVKKYL